MFPPPRLIKCTVEMTRCKLDRTYLEALDAAALSAPRHSEDQTDAADVAALREEVDSLYAEIFPVVQMSVEGQFLQPAVRRATGRNARALETSSAAVDYVGLLLLCFSLSLSFPHPTQPVT